MNAVAHVETDDLKVLYQELILDHGKSPRNARLVEHATCTAKGNNPLGDAIALDSIRRVFAWLPKAVANDAPSPVPAEQSLYVMSILDGIYRSQREGREVSITI